MRTPPDKTSLRAERNGGKPPPAYFLSLTVENLRCFGPKQTLDLSDGNGRPAPWIILLGENGVGKTTLLQCLAMLQFEYPIVMANFPDKSQFVPKMFNRQFMSGLTQSFVERTVGAPYILEYQILLTAILRSDEIGKIIKGSLREQDGALSNEYDIENIRGLTCYGYGASRRMGTTELAETQRTDTCASLFDDDRSLINAEEWLLRADYAAKSLEGPEQIRSEERRDRIKEVLKELLPDVEDIRFAPTTTPPIRTSVQVKTPYGWVAIKEMSLGYRTLMTWMVDFASRLFDRYPDSPNPLAEPAIVLVDEIDLHLHPKWQRKLMQELSDTFPNTQFIASAHSPLVVQAATNANVVLLRREGDHVIIDNDVKAIKGWRVDQVLTSDLFGLESARPPQMEDALKERTRLLSKTRLTDRDKARLSELEAEIGSLPTGETPQDIEAMDIIRRAAQLLKNQE